MQKVISFLEQNVQWIALGLGGLFLAFMVFKFVVSTPVAVNINGKVYRPGDVDTETLNVPVQQLKRDIAKTDLPEIRQKDYVESFLAAIQGSSQELPQLAANQIDSTRSAGPITPGGPDVTPGGLAGGTKPIKQLPKLPAAVAGSITSGRSHVTFQDPKWVPKPQRPDEPPAMVEADKDWWSGQFTIKAEDLVKSFKEAFNEEAIWNAGLKPDTFMKTAIIDVEVTRREVLPGGKFGEPVIIKPLQIVLDRPPFPGKNATQQEIGDYLNWATLNPNEIISPAFYEWLGGDPWLPPGEATDQMLVMDRAQRDAARKLSADAARAQAVQRRQQQLSRVRGPRNNPNGLGMAEEDGMMDAPPEFVRPQAGVRQPLVPNRPVRPGRPGQPAQPAGVPIGPGQFNVAQINDVSIICHDDTVEPGKSYQYRIRYRILNPVYNSNAAAEELTKQFEVTSPPSNWSKTVNVRAKVEFFLAQITGEKATFDVFQWVKGRTVKQSMSIAPGDSIGESGWTVVDLRGSGRRSWGLIMNDAGQLVRRDPDSDAANDRYKDLIEEAKLPPAQVGLR